MPKQPVKRTTKINKQKEIEQKKRKKRKVILILILLIIAIVGIGTYLLTSPSFNIQEITIKGNTELTQEEILESSEVKVGDNIFGTLGIVVKVKLKRNGYIEDAKIHKTYPNKLEIEVEEREKEFQIRTETGCYIYIDGQGYILDYSLDKLDLITITGMNITENGIEEKTRLEEKDLNKMENILQIREECKKINIAEKITQIHTEDEYILNLENEGITINLGDANNLKNRMYYVNAILNQEVGNRGTIYVNGNLNEGFLPYFSAE